MLTGDLFQIIESQQKNENEFTVIFCCNSSHQVFRGHFPGSPVLPGVCMIQFVRESLSFLLNREFSLYRAKSVKFINIINPRKEQKLILDLKIINTENSLTDISAQIKSDTTSFFQYRGQYKII